MVGQAREKQLEEARRLSTLQKKRELKAAGIDLPQNRRRGKGVDYLNVTLTFGLYTCVCCITLQFANQCWCCVQEVPFEIKPAAGFYATGKNESPAVPTFKQAMALQALEGKRRDEIEKEAREADKKRQKRKKEKDLPSAVDAISKINDVEQVARTTNM